MPHETEILFNEPGIQYQGVNDESGNTGAYPVQGLMVGQFKRGRLDKPMIIHRDNIKAMLGHDPKNPSYTAVQDLLGTGVPNVQVLRLAGRNAADHAYLTYGYFRDAELKINGQSFFFNEYNDDVVWFQALFEAGLGLYTTYDSLGCYELFRFQNMTDQILNISIANAQDYNWGITILQPQENKTITGSRRASDNRLEEGVNYVQFTLSPDQTHLDFSPGVVELHMNRSIDLYGTNLAGQTYQYQFIINDQPLINSANGSNLFTLLNLNDTQTLEQSFSEIGFSVSAHGYNDGSGYAYIHPNPGTPKKIKIRQLGANDDSTAMYLFTTGNRTSNEVWTETYMYDPLNLEYY